MITFQVGNSVRQAGGYDLGQIGGTNAHGATEMHRRQTALSNPTTHRPLADPQRQSHISHRQQAGGLTPSSSFNAATVSGSFAILREALWATVEESAVSIRVQPGSSSI